MYYFNLCILDINTRSFSTVAVVPATVLVICSSLQIHSDYCCSRKKLEKEIWYVFFLKKALYELTCCSPRDISAEYLCWKDHSAEEPECWTSLLSQLTTVKEEMSSLRDCHGVVPCALGLRVPLWVDYWQLWSVCSVGVRRRWFSWGCHSCSWMALRFQPGHHHRHGYMCCISRGGLFWGAKAAGQVEKALYLSVLILIHL